MDLIDDLKYLCYLLRHKYWVLRAGLVLGVPLRRLLVHDLTKFKADEWGPYRHYFYDKNRKGLSYEALRRIDAAFDRAVRLHHLRNDHHWEHWIDVEGKPVRMDLMAVREMVADWIGAGRAIRGRFDFLLWWEKNRSKIRLHPSTLEHVEGLLLKFEEYLIAHWIDYDYDAKRAGDSAPDRAPAQVDAGRVDG